MNLKPYPLTWVITVVGLFPFIYIALYTYPIADDFCYADVGRQGLLYSFGEFYQWWNGRYFASLLTSLHPISFGLTEQSYLVFGFIFSSTILSMYYFTRAFIAKSFAVPLTLLLLTHTFLIMPDITGAFYWAAAGNTYQIGVCLLMLIIARLHTSQDRSWRSPAIILLLIILSGGSVEIASVLNVLIFLFLALYHLGKSKKISFNYLLYLSASIITFLINYFSPGTAFRSSKFPNKRQFFYSFFEAFIESFDQIISLIFSPLFLFTTLSFFIFFNCIKDKLKPLNWPIYIPILVGIGVVYIVNFTAFYGMGQAPKARTFNFSIFLIYLSWVLTIIHIIQKSKIPYKSWMPASLIILSIAAFASSKNYRGVLFDLSGVAQKYSSIYQKRFKQLGTCKLKKTDHCQLEAIKIYPQTITYTDITNNISHWQNICFNDVMKYKGKVHVGLMLPSQDSIVGKNLVKFLKDNNIEKVSFWPIGFKATNKLYLNKTMNQLPELVMTFIKKNYHYVIYARKSYFSKDIHIIDFKKFPASEYIIVNPSFCNGFYRRDIPLFVIKNNSQYNGWMLDMGEQIMIKTVSKIQCSN